MRVTEPRPEAAAQEFVDAVSLWRLEPSRLGEVIDAATDALVAGLDSPSLRELAGASPRESRFVLDPLIRATIDELGLVAVRDLTLQKAALLAMLRRLRAGRVSPREVAAWAHQCIGHDGDEECQPFVDFDDVYDTEEHLNIDEPAIDHMLREEAAALLSEAP